MPQPPAPPPDGVGAVVTAFRPGAALRDVVGDALTQVRHVVVVDNTPVPEPGAAALSLPGPVELVRPGRNTGLGAALNTGVRRLLDDPATRWVLLLDQDSRVPDDLVASLRRHVVGRTGAAGPAPWDAQEGRYLDPRTRHRPEVADVPVMITSGLLLAREALEQVGTFREDFFVDCIDQDYCLRLRRAGWHVRQDRSVVLPHSLGETRWHRVGPLRVRATHHPTWRLYWAARNGVVLTREHLRTSPVWSLTNVVILARWVLVVLAFEPPRRRRVAALLAGARDGLLGRRDEGRIP